jgi:DNA-binding transcriptional MerR regulator
MTIKGNNEEYLTTAEAARYLDVAEDTVRTYCKRRLLFPDRKIGANLLFTKSECERYQRERRPRGKPPQK